MEDYSNELTNWKWQRKLCRMQLWWTDINQHVKPLIQQCASVPALTSSIGAVLFIWASPRPGTEGCTGGAGWCSKSTSLPQLCYHQEQIRLMWWQEQQLMAKAQQAWRVGSCREVTTKFPDTFKPQRPWKHPEEQYGYPPTQISLGFLSWFDRYCCCCCSHCFIIFIHFDFRNAQVHS